MNGGSWADALRLGFVESWTLRRLALFLWAVGALAGLAAVAPWAGAWSAALAGTAAGEDLARGFDFVLLVDLIRAAGPNSSGLRGWGWGTAAAALLLTALLQGGALQVVLAPYEQRSAKLFGEGCSRHALPMLLCAALSLLVAAACGAILCGCEHGARAIELRVVASWGPPFLRAGGVVLAAGAFAICQAILELTRLQCVRNPGGGALATLRTSARRAAQEPLRCLLLYGGAGAVAFAALLPAALLARAAGALPIGWGVGIWMAAQLWLLARWGCRVALWAALALPGERRLGG